MKKLNAIFMFILFGGYGLLGWYIFWVRGSFKLGYKNA